MMNLSQCYILSLLRYYALHTKCLKVKFRHYDKHMLSIYQFVYTRSSHDHKLSYVHHLSPYGHSLSCDDQNK